MPFGRQEWARERGRERAREREGERERDEREQTGWRGSKPSGGYSLTEGTFLPSVSNLERHLSWFVSMADAAKRPRLLISGGLSRDDGMSDAATFLFFHEWISSQLLMSRVESIVTLALGFTLIVIWLERSAILDSSERFIGRCKLQALQQLLRQERHQEQWWQLGAAAGAAAGAAEGSSRGSRSSSKGSDVCWTSSDFEKFIYWE